MIKRLIPAPVHQGHTAPSCVGAQIFVLLDICSVVAYVALVYPTFSLAPRHSLLERDLLRRGLPGYNDKVVWKARPVLSSTTDLWESLDAVPDPA